MQTQFSTYTAHPIRNGAAYLAIAILTAVTLTAVATLAGAGVYAAIIPAIVYGAAALAFRGASR